LIDWLRELKNNLKENQFKISNIRDEYLVELQKLRKKYEKKLR
jgi:hypothetical protein